MYILFASCIKSFITFLFSFPSTAPPPPPPTPLPFCLSLSFDWCLYVCFILFSLSLLFFCCCFLSYTFARAGMNYQPTLSITFKCLTFHNCRTDKLTPDGKSRPTRFALHVESCPPSLILRWPTLSLKWVKTKNIILDIVIDRLNSSFWLATTIRQFQLFFLLSVLLVVVS